MDLLKKRRKDNPQITYTETHDTATLRFAIKHCDMDSIVTLCSSNHTAASFLTRIMDTVKSNLFTIFTVASGKHKGTKFTIFDLYSKSAPELPAGTQIKVPGYRKTFQVQNDSLCNTTYITREILNSKGNGFTLLGITKDDMCKDVGLNEFSTFAFNEVVIKPAHIMIGNAIAKKMHRDTKKDDTTWGDCCYQVTKDLPGTLLNSLTICRQLQVIGPQPNRIINKKLPELPKWSQKCSVKVDGELFKVSTPKLDTKFARLYARAVELFKERVVESFPTRSNWRSIDFAGATVKPLPGKPREFSLTLHNCFVNGKKEAGMIISAYPKYKSDRYYPDTFNFKELQAGKILLPDGWRYPIPQKLQSDILARNPGRPEVHLAIPREKVISEIDDGETLPEDRVVGIDVNEAMFGLMTSLPASKVKDGVDFVEAIQAFHEKCPNDYMFKANLQCSHRIQQQLDKTNDHGYGILILLGIKDGRRPDESNGWKPPYDPLYHLFHWMKKRGCYNEEQLKIIATNVSTRRCISKIAALKMRYFHEQGKWDMAHQDEHSFAELSPVAREIMEECEHLSNTIEKNINYLFVAGLLRTKAGKKIAAISMEDLNLNREKKRRIAMSLYAHCATMCEIKQYIVGRTVKFSFSQNIGKAEFDFGKATVTRKEAKGLLECDSAAAQWKLDTFQLKEGGKRIVAMFSRTERGKDFAAFDTAENCIRKSIMSGTLKHRIQGICEKNLIVFRTVNPKNTSNTCHLCGNDKHLKDSESKKLISGGMKWRELVDYCAGHGKNLRAGETFICGCEKCKLHGVSQDADWNAAMVIAKRGFGKSK